MKLAEKLTFLRKEKGLSQLKLAEMMNVSRQAVSRWETGAAVPTSENLGYLSRLYDVSLDYLFDDREECPKKRDDSTDALKSKPDEDSAEGGQPNSPTVKWVVIAALCLSVLAVIFYVCARAGRTDGVVPISTMPREEVEIVPGTGFDLEEIFEGGE